jgi:hypothetical protein
MQAPDPNAPRTYFSTEQVAPTAQTAQTAPTSSAPGTNAYSGLASILSQPPNGVRLGGPGGVAQNTAQSANKLMGATRVIT